MNTRPQSRAEVALLYRDRWSWLSVPARGKHPLVKWRLEAIPELPARDDFVTLWRPFPDANLAVLTGRRSLLVVGDADPRHGGSLQMFHERGWPPDTPTVETGSGGAHIYCAYPDDGEPMRGVPDYGPGLEVKADGNIVIAPPSRHPHTQQPYRWLQERSPWDVSLKPLPPEVLAALRRSHPAARASALDPSAPSTALRGYSVTDTSALVYPLDVTLDMVITLVNRALEKSRAEHRNDVAYWLGQQLGSLGLTRQEIIALAALYEKVVRYDR